MLQQQQAPLAEQIQQLTRERNETASQLAASRDDNERLNQNTVELAKLRAEVTRLRAIQHQVAQLKNASDPFIQLVLGRTTRAAELNQHLEQMPDKRTPELQWLNENDWLNAAQEASFDTDASIPAGAEPPAESRQSTLVSHPAKCAAGVYQGQQ